MLNSKYLVNILFGLFSLAMLILTIDLGLTSNVLVALLLITIMNFPVILVHEFGHVVVARRMGARVASLAAMVFEYDFQSRRFSKWSPTKGSDVMGMVHYDFGEDGETRREAATIAAAGPAANFILGIFLFGLAAATAPFNGAEPTEPAAVELSFGTASSSMEPATLPDTETLQRVMREEQAKRSAKERMDLFQALATLLAVMSIGIGLLNLVPVNRSDGWVMWDALVRR